MKPDRLLDLRTVNNASLGLEPGTRRLRVSCSTDLAILGGVGRMKVRQRV
jgi:hypothetical protein